MLVLAREAPLTLSLRKTTITRSPYESWHEIEWLVRLGCASTRWWDSLRYEAELSFDGKTYPQIHPYSQPESCREELRDKS